MHISARPNNYMAPKKSWANLELIIIDAAKVKGGVVNSNFEGVFSDGMGGQKSSGVSYQWNKYLHS